MGKHAKPHPIRPIKPDNEDKFCENCGHRNDGSAKLCTECAHELSK